MDNQGTYTFDDEGFLTEAGGVERKYDKAGRVYSVIDSNKHETRNTYYDSEGRIEHEDILGAANSNIQYHYDDAGNMTSHTVTVEGGNGAQGYTNTYVRTYDGYKLKSESGSSTYFDPGQEDYEYDARGRLTSTHDEKGQHDQTFILNAYGEIVQKTENGSVSNWYYQDGKIVGEIDADGKVDFDNNYTPVSEHYPAMTPTSVTVANGDTLRTIAQQVYGDASLWYLIADKNGIKDGDKLVIGQILTIPNNITTSHATSSTFKPYDGSSIMGDLTPTMPIAPPPDDNDGGCGGIGGILVMAVTIVATIATAGAASIALGTASAGLGTIGAGMAALAGGDLAAAAIGGFAGNLIGQAAGNILGVEHGFDLKGALLSGATAFATAGIGNMIAGGAKEAVQLSQKLMSGATLSSEEIREVVETNVLSNAVGQGIGLAVGEQRAFDWRSVASAGVGSYLGTTGLGHELNAIPGIGSTLTSIGEQAYVNHGHINAENLAGQALGNALVQSMSARPQSTTSERELYTPKQGEVIDLDKMRQNYADMMSSNDPYSEFDGNNFIPHSASELEANLSQYDASVKESAAEVYAQASTDIHAGALPDMYYRDYESSVTDYMGTTADYLASLQESENSFKPINIDIAPHLDQTIPMIVQPGLDKSGDLWQLKINDLSPSAESNNTNGYHNVGWTEKFMYADPKNPSYHDYHVDNIICDTRELGCTPDKVYEGLKRYPAPGYDGLHEIHNGDVASIPGLGHVYHVVDDANKTIANITMSDHRLYPGQVVRSVEIDGTKVVVHTYGDGTGKYGAANSALANMLWTSVDSDIKSYVNYGPDPAAIYWNATIHPLVKPN